MNTALFQNYKGYNYMITEAILFCISLYLLNGCSSTTSITTTRPAGILLDNRVMVAVGEIQGDQSHEFCEELKQYLAEYFPAIYVPPAKLEDHNSLVMIFGTYSSETTEKVVSEGFGDKETKYKSKTWTSRFRYYITDVRTDNRISSGDVIYEENEKSEYKEKSLLGGLFESVGSSIMESILKEGKKRQRLLISKLIFELQPHVDKIEVELMKDSDLPELEAGNVAARERRWEDAISSFMLTIERHPNHKNIHKDYYNLGVAYEYTFRFEYALLYLGKASEMSVNPIYQKELESCERFQQEYWWHEEYPKRRM
ncbi:MAG: hypothetical protein QME58_13740 [Bacteroidota bacterium]|nr:hypothetical protein [Bacteroidota bacterium]